MYEVKSRSGFAWDSEKVRWAHFSTPFLRVALATNQAKKRYKTFTKADVTDQIIAPELHVYASAASLGGLNVANVEAVVIMRAKEKDRSKAIQPLRQEELPEEFQNLFGAKTNGRSVLAVFPIELLNDQNEIRVVFDREVSSGALLCSDYAMRFKTSDLR